MKNNIWKTLAAAFVAVLALSGCGEAPEKPLAEQTNPNGVASSGPHKVLIAYFSHSFGNTRQIAHMIQKETGGDIFEIKPKTPYTKVHKDVVAQARKEIDAGFKPELVAMPEKLDEYDVIFVGTPNWWNTMAPPVATFLSNHDFSGKTLVPFTTHGGSGLGRYPEDMKKLCPKANFLEGETFSRNSIPDSGDAVAKWIRRIIPDILSE
ncbi:MAG: flavodoxin [Victivallales bacterium]